MREVCFCEETHFSFIYTSYICPPAPVSRSFPAHQPLAPPYHNSRTPGFPILPEGNSIFRVKVSQITQIAQKPFGAGFHPDGFCAICVICETFLYISEKSAHPRNLRETFGRKGEIRDGGVSIGFLRGGEGDSLDV